MVAMRPAGRTHPGRENFGLHRGAQRRRVFESGRQGTFASECRRYPGVHSCERRRVSAQKNGVQTVRLQFRIRKRAPNGFLNGREEFFGIREILGGELGNTVGAQDFKSLRGKPQRGDIESLVAQLKRQKGGAIRGIGREMSQRDGGWEVDESRLFETGGSGLLLDGFPMPVI